MEIEKEIEHLIRKEIEDNNYILEKVEYKKEGKNQFLRIIIDKKGIINVEDCVAVTNLINPILDLNDPIKENYILDVCSSEKGSEEIG